MTRHYICASHVEHTRLQIDDLPCPSLFLRHLEICEDPRYWCRNNDFKKPTADHPRTLPLPPGYRREDMCVERHEEEWICPNFPRKDMSFIEDLREGEDVDFSFGFGFGGCQKGSRWMSSDEHECGLGVGVQTKWRHLDSKGRRFEKSGKMTRAEKRNLRGAKKEAEAFMNGYGDLKDNGGPSTFVKKEIDAIDEDEEVKVRIREELSEEINLEGLEDDEMEIKIEDAKLQDVKMQ